MKLRLVPRTPERLREWPRETPDEFAIRKYQANIGERFVVEARCCGRCLGDKDFATHADALAFARLEAGWHAAKLVDHTRG